MEENRVRVHNPNKEGWFGTKYEIDGRAVNNVRSVDFHVAVDEVPAFTFETIGTPDIDMNGEVVFKYHPETVQEAADIICNAAKTDKAFLDGFIASIESVLRESNKVGQCADGAAREIAERVLGL